MALVLWNTLFGDGLGFVEVLIREGHEVEIFIKDKSMKNLYDGICKKHDSIESWTHRAISTKALTIFDGVTQGKVGDYLRSKGVPVLGGQEIADKLELDRAFGMQVMADAGIKIPETYDFKDIGQGISFVKANKGRWVYKPYGAKQGSCAKTYVSENEVDLIDFMKKQKPTKFILQKFIKGEEMSCEVLFSNGVPLSPEFFDMETKKFMPGELGPNTGCQSSLEWAGQGLQSKSVKEGIGKCFDYMASVKYSGSLDLNSIIDEKGVLHGLEWTARFGYSGNYASFMLLKEPLYDFYLRLAKGTAKDIQVDNQYGFALRISIPPYPLDADDENPEEVKAVNLLMKKKKGLEIKVKKFPGIEYRMLDVYKKDGKYFTAGNDGIILEIVCKAPTIEEGKKIVYEAAKEVEIGDRQYRTDGFERAINQIPILEKMGYAERMK